jgi:death-on-curing protein
VTVPNSLGLHDVIALHEGVMRRFGLPPAGLRTEGGLESAIVRPRMSAVYEEADLVRQAALLAIGISRAQVFLDGNKRTAFAAMDVFLRINGLAYAGEPIDLARQLELVAERTDSITEATDRFESWLRDHLA